MIIVLSGEYRRGISLSDNKELAPLPTEFVTNERFPKKMDDFLNDRFGLRTYFVSMYEDVSLLKSWSFDISGKVIIGKDGWLFFNDTSWNGYVTEHFLNFTGAFKFTEKEIDSIVRNISDVNSWLADNGIKFIIVIPPMKQAIYPEQYSPIFKYGKERQYETIIARLEAAGVSVADVKGELLKNKDRELLYLKQDSHWNLHGGYAGYRSIMNEAKKYFNNLYVVDPESFDYLEHGLLTKVDLNMNKKGKHLRVTDKDETIQFKDNVIVNFIKNDERNAGFDDDYEKVTSSSANGPKIFMVRDSFSFAMLPFIEKSSSELRVKRLIWGQSPLKFKEDILKNKPDIVILETQERYLKLISTGSLWGNFL